jgi:PAS domain S-box-containing protein
VAFSAADLRQDPHVLIQLQMVKLVQLGILLVTLLALRSATTRYTVVAATLLFLDGLAFTAAASATLRGEVVSLPIFVIMLAIASAALLPWGIWAQVACVVLAGLAVLANFHLVHGVRAAFPYPGLPVVVALVASVYSAAELDHQRRERLRSERARAESKQRFRTIADAAPVLIWMTDATGRVIYLNDAWDTLLGSRREGLDMDQLWAERMHPGDGVAVGARMTAAIRARAPLEVQYRVRDREGTWRWLLVRGSPRLVGSVFRGYVGMGTDISAQKEAEAALAEARNAALEASRLKSEFLATMSHEIRTPMNGIFGMTELALDSDEESERREFLRRARACALSLMTVLSDVLDFSKIEAGKLDLEARDFDPRIVLGETLDTLAAEAVRKGLELMGSVESSVPELLCGDPNRLRQVLVNLAGNAVKFTEQGEVVIVLEVRGVSDGDAVLLHGRVRDSTGRGSASRSTRCCSTCRCPNSTASAPRGACATIRSRVTSR